MQSNSEKKWFVILNRSPRGPFSKEELNELLAQGLIRHNDLALLQEQGVPGSWKFLWQYPEFDSRRTEKNPPPPEILEKRKPRTAEQIQEELEQQIPIDLKTISIDDLIIRSKPRPKKEVDSSFISSRSSSGGLSEDTNSRPPRSVFIKAVPLLLFLLAVFGMLMTNKKKPVKLPASQSKPIAPRAVATQPETALPKARKIEVQPTSPLENPKANSSISVPQERDRGQIREEEMLRLREAERLKELEERTRREREKEIQERDVNEGKPEDEGEGGDTKGRDPESESESESESEEGQLDEEEEDRKPRKKRKSPRLRESRDPNEREEPSWWAED